MLGTWATSRMRCSFVRQSRVVTLLLHKTVCSFCPCISRIYRQLTELELKMNLWKIWELITRCHANHVGLCPCVRAPWQLPRHHVRPLHQRNPDEMLLPHHASIDRAKGLERLVAKRLAWTALSQGVLAPQHGGALPRRCAIDLVASFTHEVEHALATGRKISMVTMDV